MLAALIYQWEAKEVIGFVCGCMTGYLFGWLHAQMQRDE